MWQEEQRPKVIEENPGLSESEIQKLVSKRWKELPADVKQLLLEEQREADEKYKQECNEFMAKNGITKNPAMNAKKRKKMRKKQAGKNDLAKFSGTGQNFKSAEFISDGDSSDDDRRYPVAMDTEEVSANPDDQSEENVDVKHLRMRGEYETKLRAIKNDLRLKKAQRAGQSLKAPANTSSPNSSSVELIQENDSDDEPALVSASVNSKSGPTTFVEDSEEENEDALELRMREEYETELKTLRNTLSDTGEDQYQATDASKETCGQGKEYQTMKLFDDFENEEDILEAKLYEAKLEAFCSKALAQGVTDEQGNLVRGDMEREWKNLYASIPGNPKNIDSCRYKKVKRKWLDTPKIKRIIEEQKNRWRATQEAYKKICMAKNITTEATAGNNKESAKEIRNDEPSFPSTSEGPQISKRLENQTLSYLEDLGPCSSEQSKSKAAGHVENQKQEDVLERSIRLEYEEGLASNSVF